MSYHCKGRTRSLYIHWPFCPYKCHFCPFVALASHDQFMERYQRALLAEIQSYTQSLPSALPLDTIYLGGGTPSTWPDALLLDMFDTLKRSFKIDLSTEITIEVNPGTVPAGRLETWKEAGINRLSIGVQSLNDKALQRLNRLQKTEDVVDLLDRASSLFNNLSIDLILGLPDVSEKEWKRTIEWATARPIKHISVYFLTVHQDTPLYFKVLTRKVSLLRDERMVALYHWTCDMLKDRGFLQYELSNFSKKGYESRHNKVYWRRVPYRGFGLGACSFDGTTRIQNEKNLIKYMSEVEGGKNPVSFSETLSQEQVFLEELMLGLRQSGGVDVSAASCGFSSVRRHQIQKGVADLVGGGFLTESDGFLRLTPSGLAVENEVLERLSH